MSVRIMKIFCDLVEEGSFSKAAEMNEISQSAVSQQIARLEKKMAVKLVHRSGGKIQPTEAGKTYYKASKDIVPRYLDMLDQINTDD